MSEKQEKDSVGNTAQRDSAVENEALLKRMMQVEAAIERTDAAIRTSEKKIKQIKKSNTWKRTATFSKFFSKTPPNEQIAALEREILELREHLYKATDDLESLKMQQEKYDYNRIWRMAREKKTNGEIVNLIESAVKQKQTADENYKKLIDSTARLFMREKAEYRELIFPKLFARLKVEDIPEFMVRSGFSEDKIPLTSAASFRASLTMRMREYQLRGNLPEMILDDKQTAYQFAEKLAVRIPEISNRTYRFDEIPEEDNIAIKPVDGAGARGVYLVYADDDIIDIKQSKKVANWQVLKMNMEKDLLADRVHRDEWFTEELIMEDRRAKTPARDIKFYCFYGKVGLILEIVRYPEHTYCWWTVSGERVATGKYEESLFKGVGVRADEIALAERMSAEVPAPFIRIDFLRSDTGLVFGEFTPKPGNYDEFDDQTDQWLGDYFLDAQGRLAEDLLNGKEFTHFKNLVSHGSTD